MLALRTPLIPLTVLAGATLGALAWLAAGRQDPFGSLQEQLSALRPGREAELSAGAAVLSGPPLFALSTGPNAVRDPAVAVLGLSRMPGRSAALLSVDGKPAVWLALGQSRDGVILREVGGGRASLDLPLGVRTLRIGEAVAGTSSAAAPTPSTLAPVASGLMSDEAPPPGARLPPPPASAPGMGG